VVGWDQALAGIARGALVVRALWRCSGSVEVAGRDRARAYQARAVQAVVVRAVRRFAEAAEVVGLDERRALR
jgi:hypothetical protein